MAKDKNARKRMGRPPKDNKLSRAFNVKCDERTFQGIESFRSDKPRMTQSEAVRQLIESALKSSGLLK